MSDAAARWREQLLAWAIPPAILDAAPVSPFGFPAELFVSRAERARDDDPSAVVARAALGDGGSVLDVGAGGGAASLPLAPPATRLVAVDPSRELLDAFLRGASTRGVEAAAVEGAWPDAADATETCDVVVCHHVLYNVADLAPFLAALTAHARRRVVVEITDEHPLAWTRDLWRTLHGVERPAGPRAADAVAVAAELGIDVRRQDSVRRWAAGGFARREDAIALIRRRLCVGPERDAEIERLLGDRLAEDAGLWNAGPPAQPIVTLWWEP